MKDNGLTTDYYMASFVFPREADGVRLTRIIATLRSAESGAAAIAFGINSIGLSLIQVSCEDRNPDRIAFADV